ncbi:unnamed protein product [Boreogadus saida]
MAAIWSGRGQGVLWSKAGPYKLFREGESERALRNRVSHISRQTCGTILPARLYILWATCLQGRSTYLCVCLADIYGHLKLHVDHTELLKESYELFNIRRMLLAQRAAQGTVQALLLSHLDCRCNSLLAGLNCMPAQRLATPSIR